MNRCDNCWGPLNYHSDDACAECHQATPRERQRRQLLRLYHQPGAFANDLKKAVRGSAAR